MNNPLQNVSSIVALVTPMAINGDIDFPALESLLQWHLSQGTEAIVLLGTTGEAPTISAQEREQIIKQAVAYVDKKIPIIVGTGSNCTTQTIALSKQAQALGADAILLVAPYYNKPTQLGLVKHFTTIANEVAIPQLLYNVPSRTITDISPETVITLATHQNIIGIKEASGELDRIDTIRSKADPEFLIYSGNDDNIYPFMTRGGNGVISVTANLLPKKLKQLCHSINNHDHSSAEALFNLIQPINHALFLEANPIPVKWALTEMGKIKPGMRLPLTTLSKHHHNTLLQALNELSLLAE